MAGPTQLNPTEQDALVKQIGLALLRAAPAEWTSVEVAFRAIGRYTEVLGQVSFGDERTAEFPVAPEVVGLFARLRAGMYREGRGTWFNARYQLDRPAAYNLEYDRDEPEWQNQPPPPAFVDELRMFPREEENVPDWLARRLSAIQPPFRTARIFDGIGPAGPVVTRPPLEAEEREQVQHYLDAAPLALPARGYDTDHLDEERRQTVPVAFHTDGVWIWPAAVNYYLRTHGVSPDPDLVAHIRRAEFRVPEVDEQARTAAAAFIAGPRRPPVPPPVPAPLPEPVAPEPVAPEPVHDEANVPDPVTVDEPLPPPADAPADVVALLRERLGTLGVDPSRYTVGTPSGAGWAMEQTGEGWRVGFFDGHYVAPAVFADPADAAAFLAGKLLLEPAAPATPPSTVRASLAELEDDDDDSFDQRSRMPAPPPSRPVQSGPSGDDLFRPARPVDDSRFEPGKYDDEDDEYPPGRFTAFTPRPQPADFTPDHESDHRGDSMFTPHTEPPAGPSLFAAEPGQFAADQSPEPTRAHPFAEEPPLADRIDDEGQPAQGDHQPSPEPEKSAGQQVDDLTPDEESPHGEHAQPPFEEARFGEQAPQQDDTPQPVASEDQPFDQGPQHFGEPTQEHRPFAEEAPQPFEQAAQHVGAPTQEHDLPFADEDQQPFEQAPQPVGAHDQPFADEGRQPFEQSPHFGEPAPQQSAEAQNHFGSQAGPRFGAPAPQQFADEGERFEQAPQQVADHGQQPFEQTQPQFADHGQQPFEQTPQQFADHGQQPFEQTQPQFADHGQQPFEQAPQQFADRGQQPFEQTQPQFADHGQPPFEQTQQQFAEAAPQHGEHAPERDRSQQPFGDEGQQRFGEPAPDHPQQPFGNASQQPFGDEGHQRFDQAPPHLGGHAPDRAPRQFGNDGHERFDQAPQQFGEAAPDRTPELAGNDGQQRFEQAPQQFGEPAPGRAPQPFGNESQQQFGESAPQPFGNDGQQRFEQAPQQFVEAQNHFGGQGGQQFAGPPAQQFVAQPHGVEAQQFGGVAPVPDAGPERREPFGQGGFAPQGAERHTDQIPHQPEPQPVMRRPQDWPIQPLAGEPPLTLFRGKQLTQLPEGMEIDRYGDASGNLTYAVGTPFDRRSLVPDWINRPYRAYRVVRPTDALTGSAIPWFDQPGGGTAFVLSQSIAELLDKGVLEEIPDRQPPARA